MSIYVCITLTYEIQMLICYQNELKFLKIVYFEGTYYHLYKLLPEWQLNLILLPSYNTGNII